MNRLILVLSPVALTPEHVVAQMNIRGVLQIEKNCVPYSFIDTDVAVFLNLPRISGLGLQNGEASLECEVVADQVGEPQQSQVTDSQPKVNTHNEEHVVSPSSLVDQVLGDTVDILHTLNRLSGVLRSQVIGDILNRWCDEAGLDLHAPLLDLGDIDQARGFRLKLNYGCHLVLLSYERFN